MKKLSLLLIVIAFTSIQFANAQDIFQQHGFTKKPLTLSNGRYNEFFNNDEVVQIGTVLLNAQTNKIVAFVEEDTLENAYQSVFASRWLSIDPLAAKYPQFSPYVYVADNPLRYIDPDGKDIVDPKGNHVSITYNKNGSLSFSKNATADIRRIANALNLTETGRSQLRKVDKSDIHTSFNISSEAKIGENSKGECTYRYGATTQGNFDKNDNYGKVVNSDGTYGVKESSITIYEGTLKEGIKDGSGLKHEGLTMEQAIGAVAGHEIVHGTDKSEINKDIKSELEGNSRTKEREVKPVQVEQKIIDESKKLNE